jgi:prepilin-type N-terminal cleavage/methylation domain-containing protein
MRAPKRTNEAGFTLLEVLVALLVLAFVLTMMASSTTRAAVNQTRSTAAIEAAAAADAEVARARLWPDYSTLNTFAGTRSNTPRTGMTRQTTVVRVGGAGQTRDFTRITVRISSSELAAPVERTISIASP